MSVEVSDPEAGKWVPAAELCNVVFIPMLLLAD